VYFLPVLSLMLSVCEGERGSLIRKESAIPLRSLSTSRPGDVVYLGSPRHRVLRVLNRTRCRTCSRCRSILVSHWIISRCRPRGGQIKLSRYTYYTSPSLKPRALYVSDVVEIIRGGGLEEQALIGCVQPSLGSPN